MISFSELTKIAYTVFQLPRDLFREEQIRLAREWKVMLSSVLRDWCLNICMGWELNASFPGHFIFNAFQGHEGGGAPVFDFSIFCPESRLMSDAEMH